MIFALRVGAGRLRMGRGRLALEDIPSGKQVSTLEARDGGGAIAL